MAKGILLNDGQNHFLNILFKTLPPQDYYLGLMTNTVNPGVTDQLGSGITEVTGSGYARILVSRDTDWTVAGPLAISAIKIFNVGPGGWLNCNGFILCESLAGNDVVLAQAFPAAMQGNYSESEEIEIDLNLMLRDSSEDCDTPPEPPVDPYAITMAWRDHNAVDHGDPHGTDYHNDPIMSISYSNAIDFSPTTTPPHTVTNIAWQVWDWTNSAWVLFNLGTHYPQNNVLSNPDYSHVVGDHYEMLIYLYILHEDYVVREITDTIQFGAPVEEPPVTDFNWKVSDFSYFNTMHIDYTARSAIDLQDLSSNAPSSWIWEVYNRTTMVYDTFSTVQNPVAIDLSNSDWLLGGDDGDRITIKLTSTNAFGSDEQILNIYVDNVPAEAPIADFKWRDHDYAAHGDPHGSDYHNDHIPNVTYQNIDFKDYSLNTPTIWLWEIYNFFTSLYETLAVTQDIDNHFMDRDGHPEYVTYTGPNGDPTFNVKLTVTNGSGSDSIIKQLIMDSPPA
jgi:hypothetical protein